LEKIEYSDDNDYSVHQSVMESDVLSEAKFIN
jgi:hypothetical protein